LSQVNPELRRERTVGAGVGTSATRDSDGGYDKGDFIWLLSRAI
jgi:hypothetical protein